MLLFLPFAKSSGGISTSMADGVYKIQFSGSLGQIVALLVSTDSGEKQASSSGMPTTVNGSSEKLSGRARYFSSSLLSFSPRCLFRCCVGCSATGLTNRWSQPLAVAMCTFDL